MRVFVAMTWLVTLTLIVHLLSWVFGVGVEVLYGPVAIGLLSVIITDLYYEGGRFLDEQ